MVARAPAQGKQKRVTGFIGIIDSLYGVIHEKPQAAGTHVRPNFFDMIQAGFFISPHTCILPTTRNRFPFRPYRILFFVID
jgi:hypothetical protein